MVKYHGYYITSTPDVEENAGGRFYQIYSDESCDNEVDNFCLSKEQLTDEDKLVRQYVDKLVGEKEYICFDDLEGDGFHEGDTRTAEGWREWAMSMNDYDEFDEELRKQIKELPAEKVVYLIADIWQLDIVLYDRTNPEHKELREEWESE